MKGATQILDSLRLSYDETSASEAVETEPLLFVRLCSVLQQRSHKWLLVQSIRKLARRANFKNKFCLPRTNIEV